MPQSPEIKPDRLWYTPQSSTDSELQKLSPPIGDDELFGWINEYRYKLDQDYSLVIGTDSHLHRRGGFKFVSVVCLYQKGRGGYYHYTTSRVPKTEFKGNYLGRIRSRMFLETERTIELAQDIQAATGLRPIVHLDVSPPGTAELSAQFADQLRGYVVACDFDVVIKPFGFAASGIANKHTKP